jgi:hypothetical protein
VDMSEVGGGENGEECKIREEEEDGDEGHCDEYGAF